MDTLTLEKSEGVATVSLNRPKVHNAFNEDMMKELEQTFKSLQNDSEAKVVVIKGNGASFCAGGDLNYMKTAKDKSRQQNIDESLFMARMFRHIDQLSKPVVGVVHGAVFGGGVGLAAVCDVVLAHKGSKFSFSEVKLGLNPSVISPFVISKIGASHARRLFLTGERFGAELALRAGLVHEIYNETPDELLTKITNELLRNGSDAMAQAKLLVYKNTKLHGEELTQFTAEQIANLRESPEAQTRMEAFLSKQN